MICPPCARLADVASAVDPLFEQGDDYTPAHDPAICRDAHIPGHGCTCQHGQTRRSDQ